MCVSPKAKLFPLSIFFQVPIFFAEQIWFLTKKMEIENQKWAVHFKKTVAQIQNCGTFCVDLYWKYLPQFWKKRDSLNCLLKMNGL